MIPRRPRYPPGCCSRTIQSTASCLRWQWTAPAACGPPALFRSAGTRRPTLGLFCPPTQRTGAHRAPPPPTQSRHAPVPKVSKPRIIRPGIFMQGTGKHMHLEDKVRQHASTHAWKLSLFRSLSCRLACTCMDAASQHNLRRDSLTAGLGQL